MNSPHKWPVTQKMFPFDDIIMVVLTFFYVTIGNRDVKLPWIYLGAPLISNGAFGNIQGNLNMYVATFFKGIYFHQSIICMILSFCVQLMDVCIPGLLFYVLL